MQELTPRANSTVKLRAGCPSDHCRCGKGLADFLSAIEGIGRAEIGACCGGNRRCAASGRRNKPVGAGAVLGQQFSEVPALAAKTGHGDCASCGWTMSAYSIDRDWYWFGRGD